MLAVNHGPGAAGNEQRPIRGVIRAAELAIVYRIIPAPTVLLLLSSMTMKAPVPRFSV